MQRCFCLSCGEDFFRRDFASFRNMEITRLGSELHTSGTTTKESMLYALNVLQLSIELYALYALYADYTTLEATHNDAVPF